jgi:hypothetical protein
MRTTSMIGRNAPLTDDQIRSVAPSIFAEDKHASRSERYTFIPTSEVLAGLRAEGFQPYSVKQGGTRIPGKAEYTKHVLRLRRDDSEALRQVGDSIFEVVLLNSHDGTSAYKLDAGVFRLVCLNGMIVKDGSLPGVKVGHRGNIVHDVIDASYEVVKQAETVMGRVEDMRNIVLDTTERRIFAQSALNLRYDGPNDAGFAPPALLHPRRTVDTQHNLWTTTNVVQENLIRGGQHRRGRVDADGKRLRDTSAREVRAIDSDTKINRALWEMAEMLRAYHGKEAA